MTHESLIAALVQSKNEAADDALLEALKLGNHREKELVLAALFARHTTHGLSGVVGQFEQLPELIQRNLLANIKPLHHAIREAGRSSSPQRRLAAMKLIALGHQGKLAYVLSENMHEPDADLSKGAVDALVGLARWVATETRSLQRGGGNAAVHHELIDQRGEIEQTVARALDGHRGKHGAELLRAALLLCDWPGSKTLSILTTGKHGGQSAMVRRLQQPPASEHVEAFLLGASHGGLRSHFGITFSHIEEAPVLDALLRKTHWLKDLALQNCVHMVARGVWWGDAEITRDISRRDAGDAARISDWLVLSGVHDVVQDERLERLRQHAVNDFGGRLRVLRSAASRKRGTSTQLYKSFLTDPDERLMRMAARELVRRRAGDAESQLLQMMTTAPQTVRRVIGRAVGQSGFEQFWINFDRLDKATRRQAGKAMFKVLPDAIQRLSRRLASPIMEQRLKAMQIVQELKLAESVKDRILPLCSDPNPRLRSKAVSVLGEIGAIAPESLIERLLSDSDPRVRANTIEILETHHQAAFVPLLVQRARMGTNRERANAIRTLHKLRIATFEESLKAMLNDPRPEHRISAMWALKETNWWGLISEVGKMAKVDEHMRVRRYAMAVLKSLSEMIRQQRAKTA